MGRAARGLARPVDLCRDVDRRFYRRRYDAVAAAAMFAGQLRSQIDLDALDTELIAAINRTVQPSHVTLWLRR
jgi:hypothetical protein